MVDVDPAKVGLTLDQLAGRDQTDQNQPCVVHRLDEALIEGADVAILTTSSHFDAVAPMVLEVLDRGLAVVSSCEQMLWPWYRHRALANQVNAAAERAGRAVLGTGVNPGFVMDSLPVVMSSMLRRVKRVRCVRRVDASLRRAPLQAKVGATMAAEKFNELASQGRIGHQGLVESVALLAAGLGRKVKPDSVTETLEPCLADRPVSSALGLIEPGRVCGMRNVASWRGRDLRIELDLTMAVDLPDPKDTVELDGPVRLVVEIPGSVPGDSATVAALSNYVRVVHEAKPGLRTMLDVPTAGCRGR